MKTLDPLELAISFSERGFTNEQGKNICAKMAKAAIERKDEKEAEFYIQAVEFLEDFEK